MTRRQARAFAARHGLAAADFFSAGETPGGVPLWRCRPEALLAAAVCTEAEILAAQRRAS